MTSEVPPMLAGLIAALADRGVTVATAESLTGGLVCAALTAAPGSSAVVRGGVVAYDVAVKSQVLGVDADLLARLGAVHPDVALQMARGVRRVVGADYGVATTGAAGPDPDPGGREGGQTPPGRGFVAVCGPRGEAVEAFAGSELMRETLGRVLDHGNARASAGEGSVE